MSVQNKYLTLCQYIYLQMESIIQWAQILQSLKHKQNFDTGVTAPLLSKVICKNTNFNGVYACIET